MSDSVARAYDIELGYWASVPGSSYLSKVVRVMAYTAADALLQVRYQHMYDRVLSIAPAAPDEPMVTKSGDPP